MTVQFANPIRLGLCLVGVAVLPALGSPETSWNCRNTDFEISCDGGKCAAAQAYTPMDIHLSGQDMSICAYTTCWSGAPVLVQSVAGFVTYIARELPGSGDPKDRVDAVISIDARTGVASVLVAGRYAVPAICTQR